MRRLISANRLEDDGFSEWLFYPGMFFLDRNKWWGDGGPRQAPHEGVDFCFYRTSATDHRRLQPQARIPAVAAGRVLAIIDDFLGKSIIMHHPVLEWGKDRVCTIFGHTVPLAGLSAGEPIAAGEIVARLAACTRSRGPGPHLHVSLALIDRRRTGKELTWPALSRSRAALFLDPINLIMEHPPHRKAFKTQAEPNRRNHI